MVGSLESALENVEREMIIEALKPLEATWPRRRALLASPSA